MVKTLHGEIVLSPWRRQHCQNIGKSILTTASSIYLHFHWWLKHCSIQGDSGQNPTRSATWPETLPVNFLWFGESSVSYTYWNSFLTPCLKKISRIPVKYMFDNIRTEFTFLAEQVLWCNAVAMTSFANMLSTVEPSVEIITLMEMYWKNVQIRELLSLLLRISIDFKG